MKAGFKMGDKVRVISSSYGGFYKDVSGTVVSVSHTNQDWPYEVDFNDGDGPYPFSKEELKILKEKRSYADL